MIPKGIINHFHFALDENEIHGILNHPGLYCCFSRLQSEETFFSHGYRHFSLQTENTQSCFWFCQLLVDQFSYPL